MIEVDEDTPVDKTIFAYVSATDADSVGETIEVECVNLPTFSNACDMFSVETIDSSQSSYHGAIVLRQSLDYARQQSYQFQLRATVIFPNALLQLHVNQNEQIAFKCFFHTKT